MTASVCVCVCVRVSARVRVHVCLCGYLCVGGACHLYRVQSELLSRRCSTPSPERFSLVTPQLIPNPLPNTSTVSTIVSSRSERCVTREKLQRGRASGPYCLKVIQSPLPVCNSVPMTEALSNPAQTYALSNIAHLILLSFAHFETATLSPPPPSPPPPSPPAPPFCDYIR